MGPPEIVQKGSRVARDRFWSFSNRKSIAVQQFWSGLPKPEKSKTSRNWTLGCQNWRSGGHNPRELSIKWTPGSQNPRALSMNLEAGGQIPRELSKNWKPGSQNQPESSRITDVFGSWKPDSSRIIEELEAWKPESARVLENYRCIFENYR